MEIEQRKSMIGSWMIIGSSILWGTALLYSQYVLDNGISSKDLVSLKMFFGFVTMVIYIFIKDKNLLKIDKRGIYYCATIGFICHALYNLFIFSAMERTSISTAVTLLYTSPIFVMIVSRLLYKEEISPNKLLALILCVIGCFLTVTGGNISNLNLNISGVLFGLASGICYGTMTLLNKKIVNDYEQITILTYTFGFAFLFSLTFSNPISIIHIPYNPLVYTFVIMLGVLSTAVSYLFYIKGLSHGIQSSNAAIIATLEVPVSVVGAVLLFNQDLSFVEVIGILFVLISVVLLNEKYIENMAYRIYHKNS
ncbi:MAG: EamA family transporter [Tissierella sp.]|nr:EamA family transporter [Tissierella sp.]